MVNPSIINKTNIVLPVCIFLYALKTDLHNLFDLLICFELFNMLYIICS